MSLKALTCAMALRGVTSSEKLLLLALANYADEDMRCYPSQGRLAEDTCLSDRTIRSLLLALEARRIISRKERRRADHSRASDIVTLHFAGEVAEAISGGAEIISGGVGKPLPGDPEITSGLTTFEPSVQPTTVAKAPVERARRPSRRCPLDWSPSIADLAVADGEGFTPGEIERELAKFRDHEFQAARQDWSGTFRNWIRRAAESPARHERPSPNQPSASHGRQSRTDDRQRAALAVLEERGAFEPANPVGRIDRR